MLDKVPAKAGAKVKNLSYFLFLFKFEVPAKRGDEKRRDFEHGWEQCEVSFFNYGFNYLNLIVYF